METYRIVRMYLRDHPSASSNAGSLSMKRRRTVAILSRHRIPAPVLLAKRELVAWVRGLMALMWIASAVVASPFPLPTGCP